MSRSRPISTLLSTALFAALTAIPGIIGAASPQTAAIADPIDPVIAPDGTAAIVVRFSAEPAARVWAARTRAGESDAARATATRSAAERARAEQNDGMAALGRSGLAYTELYRLQRTANAVVLRTNPENMARLRQLPGVVSVDYAPVHVLTNSTSVPFTGAPQVWGNTIGLPGGGLTGTGIKIGIIDTGIDYQHPTFGGTGVLADYQANDRTVITDTIGGNPIFPSARVVGGMDFVGDLYTGANTPVPDPDPMDCNGHGSHVAGSAAGGGVTAANAPYTGPYDTSTNFASLKIGPGVAPQANLYALRVFGCGGSTTVTAQAIEWAVDPNGDDNFGDRLDVINMSLGSNFGVPNDLTAETSSNATLTGMVVVASAGNAGDTFYISGSPGASGEAIAVANILDNGLAGPLRVNAPAAIAGFMTTGTASFGVAPGPSGLTSDIVYADDGSTAVVPPTTGTGTINDGCQTPFVNAAAVAGKIALVDRGGCGFKFKARNAELNGAIGVIIANLPTSATPGTAPGMADDPTLPAVNVPVASVNLANGDLLRANIAAPTNITMFSGADTASASTSRGPRGGGSAFRLKPDMAAPGTSISSAQTGVTCTGTAPSTGCQVANASGFLPNGAVLTISGTSMAAPHVAGMMGLLRQQNPSLSVEQLKALATSSAMHNITVGPGGLLDTYASSRVGSGRMDAPAAATASLIAYDEENDGASGVAFDFEPTAGNSSTTRTIRIQNRRAAPQTVDLSIDTILNAPGVTFSIEGPTTITVPGPGSAAVTVRLSTDVAAMDRNRDPTMAPTQGVGAPASLLAFGQVARHFIAEESALLKVSTGGSERARVALNVAIRPHGTMQSAVLPGGLPATGTTQLALSGEGVCTGTAGAGTCTANLANEQQGLVSPFELQVNGARDTAIPAYANVRHFGVNFDPAASNFQFGIATWGEWSTLGNVAFNVCIDNNEDGTYDRVVFTGDLGQFARLTGQNVSGQDTFMSGVFTPPSSLNFGVAATPRFVNGVSAAVADTAVHDTNVAFFTATAADLGLTAGDNSFRYEVATCPGFNPLCVRLTTLTSCTAAGAFQTVAGGPYFYNGSAQGFSTPGGLGGSNMLFPDVPGSSLSVTFDKANLQTNGSSGLLLLHHHNTSATRAQVVRFDDLFADGFE